MEKFIVKQKAIDWLNIGPIFLCRQYWPIIWTSVEINVMPRIGIFVKCYIKISIDSLNENLFINHEITKRIIIIITIINNYKLLLLLLLQIIIIWLYNNYM